MRRDPLEIMEKILAALEKGQPRSMHALCQETKLHYVTVRRYVQIIELVSREPEIEVIKTGHTVILRIRREKEE
ncbi:MAG: hypothetical protein HY520_00095 [Candidatus Aenigmarchaeota archaeon]|nr:hypothetical protein [Candidatus Aenigmarchaeota archaeon]